MSILNEKVLILNKNWSAIGVRNIKKCILMVCRERAMFVDSEDYSIYTWEEWIEIPVKEKERGISTTRGKIKIPKVVLLTFYKDFPIYIPKFTKRNVFLRDKYKCQYSGKKVSKKDADIDHVIPLSRKGKNTWDNTVVCSKKINRMKGNKTPEEAGLKLLKKPKRPSGRQLLIELMEPIDKEWRKFLL